MIRDMAAVNMNAPMAYPNIEECLTTPCRAGTQGRPFDIARDGAQLLANCFSRKSQKNDLRDIMSRDLTGLNLSTLFTIILARLKIQLNEYKAQSVTAFAR